MLALMASASTDSCETGGEVNLNWIVTSGVSGNYTVSVDGTEQSGASAKLTCQATAGTQSVKVTATDTTYKQLTATRTLNVTVTKPTPSATVTAQIHARRLADNRVEFRLRLADGTVETTDKRYMKLPEIVAGRWYASGAFTTTIEGVEYTLGAVSVRLDNPVCPAQVEVTFIPAGGERITPTQYKLPVNREADSWAMTSEFAVPLQPSSAVPDSAQSEAGYWMVAAPEGAKDGPGREGGLMLGDAPDALNAAQDNNAQKTCTDQPTGLGTSNITSSGVTLTWGKVSSASQYDVAVDNDPLTSLGAAQLRYDFTRLKADHAYTLKVQARSWRGVSKLSSVGVRTKAVSLPTVTIGRGASSITEGGSARFTVSSDRAVSKALVVKLSVTETGSMISGAAVTQVTLSAGGKTATLSVSTSNDAVDEPHSVVTAQVEAGSGYRIGSPKTAAVTVLDNDEAIVPPPPSCSGPEPSSTRSVRTRETSTETHANGRALRTNERTKTQAQARSVQCRNGQWATGAWGDSGAPSYSAWVLGVWSCSSMPSQPANRTRTLTVSTSTAWQVSGATARQIRTTVTQRQRQSHAWSGPALCLWQAGTWTNNGAAVTTRTVLRTKLKPTPETFYRDSSPTATGRRRVMRVQTTPICLEQMQREHAYYRTTYSRTYQWGGSSWNPTVSQITPPVRYRYWLNAGSQRLCALRAQDSAAQPEAAPALREQFAAGTHEMQWGVDRLRFTVPAAATITVVSRVLDTGDIAAVFVAESGAELVVTVGALSQAAPSSSDATLSQLASTLSLARSTSSIEIDDDSPACDTVPESDIASVNLDNTVCAQTVGQTITIELGGMQLKLALSAGRDWLLMAAPDPGGSGAMAVWLTDLASGSLLALDPSSGKELGRVIASDAIGVSALFDAIAVAESP